LFLKIKNKQLLQKDFNVGIPEDKKMSDNTINLHMAKKKLKLNSCNFHMSVVSTLWKGEVILCYFDTIKSGLTNVFCSQEVGPDDIELLEELIKDFLYRS